MDREDREIVDGSSPSWVSTTMKLEKSVIAGHPNPVVVGPMCCVVNYHSSWFYP